MWISRKDHIINVFYNVSGLCWLNFARDLQVFNTLIYYTTLSLVSFNLQHETQINYDTIVQFWACLRRGA